MTQPTPRPVQESTSLRELERRLAASEAERKGLELELAETAARHREADERIHRDLELAREIQQGLLPEPIPDWEALELQCYSCPALEIGGDFYTYRESNNAKVLLSKYVLAVGDVSGKGVSAALLMATALSQFDTSFARPIGPAERLGLLDRQLMPYTKPRRQNCALCCIEIVGVNTVNPILRVANAGCIPPYVRQTDGSVEWIVAEGPPLGLGLGARKGYTEVSQPLQKGDAVILVSDGAVECRNEDDELFGFERLEATIASAPSSEPEQLVTHLRDAVTDFGADCDHPHDDVTLVVARL